MHTTTSSQAGPVTPGTVAPVRIDIPFPGGRFTLALDGSLPPAWPTDLPLPPGAAPAGSGSFAFGGSGKVGVYNVPSLEETFDFYAKGSLPVVSSSHVGEGNSFVGMVVIGGDKPMSIYVAPATGRPLLAVVLTSSE